MIGILSKTFPWKSTLEKSAVNEHLQRLVASGGLLSKQSQEVRAAIWSSMRLVVPACQAVSCLRRSASGPTRTGRFGEPCRNADARLSPCSSSSSLAMATSPITVADAQVVLDAYETGAAVAKSVAVWTHS